MPDREPRIQSAPRAKLERPQIHLTQEQISEIKNHIQSKTISTLLKKLNSFPPETHNEIATILIQHDKSRDVIDSVFGYHGYDRFSGFDLNIAKLLVEKGQGGFVVGNTDKFPSTDQDEIAKFLIEKGWGAYFAEHLENFSGIDHVKIATFILERGDTHFIIDNLEQFTGLDANFAKLYIQKHLHAPAFISELGKLGIWKDTFFDNFEICVAFADLAYNSEENLALLKTHTFFTKAVEANPRDVPRLMAKFPTLDKDSQENIVKLYEIKNSTNIDPLADPVEYRKFAQEKLLDYKNNREIYYLASARVGKPIDTWLNYNATEDFTLGAEEDVPFTEMVRTPIARIEEMFSVYNTALKTEIGKFREELLAHKINADDTLALQAEEVKMRDALERARTEGNEKKVQGIEKGLTGLRNRIQNPKMIALWDKIVGDYDGVTRLQRDVVIANNAIKKLEMKEKDLVSTTLSILERRKQVQALKVEREILENQFKDKLGVMNARFEAFQGALPNLLFASIGQEQVDELLKQVTENTGEYMDHYKTDMKTLEDILRGDDKKEHLEGRSMSIELWNRDPDVDLYLGNYTSCCVAIDNEVHGENSPISDYLTDIGMQVITITDQKRGRPVVAAWCYIGTDEEKNVALVIDNIEADTSYSIPFKAQLEDKMRKYVNAYATASGIRLVSQGPHNNDLEVASLEEKYTKLGGYNIEDGYYLEAEPD